jgi:hypothetical protein
MQYVNVFLSQTRMPRSCFLCALLYNFAGTKLSYLKIIRNDLLCDNQWRTVVDTIINITFP